MNSNRRKTSETPDGDLDLHQLHCRYAILWGADMKKANQLWKSMMDYNLDRNEYLAALSREMGLPLDSSPCTHGAENFSLFDDHILFEGNPYRHLAIRYERNRHARRECIKVYGRACAVCGFEFGDAYGAEMEDKILVHHLEMVSASGGCRAIDPARDMRPVCANCHYVIHQRNPPYTIEEVRNMLSFGG